ncbi:MAG: hypothetical protein QOH35_5838 [Acidobacteriaceae bacterium]|jgi:hypothetical protein|nr:hypothetical protein [Acidobacteriaceae bacterium]
MFGYSRAKPKAIKLQRLLSSEAVALADAKRTSVGLVKSDSGIEQSSSSEPVVTIDKIAEAPGVRRTQLARPMGGHCRRQELFCDQLQTVLSDRANTCAHLNSEILPPFCACMMPSELKHRVVK